MNPVLLNGASMAPAKLAPLKFVRLKRPNRRARLRLAPAKLATSLGKAAKVEKLEGAESSCRTDPRRRSGRR